MRVLFILLFLFSFSFSKTYIGTYKISYGIFGELGIAKALLQIDENKYKISIEAYATGIAKFLSKEKKEIYISQGKIFNNTFYPQTYTTDKKNLTKHRIKNYEFNHDEQTIMITEIKDDIKKVLKMNYETKNERVKSQSSFKSEFFAQNDILSLFFNITRNFEDIKDGKDYEYKAIGAKEENGKINIYRPTNQEKKNLDKFFKNKDKKLIVKLNQGIFSSKEGELLISINKDGFSNLAILKDVILFGDIKGKLIKFEIKE